MAGLRPVRAYLSFARVDAGYLRRLLLVLSPLMRAGHLEVWFADGPWGPAMPDGDRRVALDTMDIFVAVVSPAYLTSADRKEDLAAAIERINADTAHGVVVHLHGAIPAEIEGWLRLPEGPALQLWSDLDQAFEAVQRGIETLVATTTGRSDAAGQDVIPADPSEIFHTLTAANFHNATLADWHHAFWLLYENCDRQTPLYGMVLQIVADATRLAEAVRKNNLAEALPYIPRMYSWLFNLVHRLQLGAQDDYEDLHVLGGLEELVWTKYPRVCSLCAQRQCICPLLRVDHFSQRDREKHESMQRHTLALARAQDGRPRALDDWVQMFNDIYGMAHARLSLHDKVLHLFEEIGELEVELRKADRVNTGQLSADTSIDLSGELADVFSWIASIYSDMRNSIDRAWNFVIQFEAREPAAEMVAPGGIDQSLEVSRTALLPRRPPTLSQWMWREFGADDGQGLRCHRCEQLRCVCAPLINRR